VGDTPVLELDGVTKQYGRTWALSGLSLRVQPGEVYGFLGRNGAGKSTAIRIVMGILPSTGGDVKLFGTKASRGTHVALRRRIGYVAQEQSFYGWMTTRTIGKFVRGFYPGWDDAEYERLVGELELPREQRIATFSGGMKVKLALAIAFAHRPELLVLDEPTAGLDPLARREFLEHVRDRATSSGTTTFFSTHLIDEIELAAHRVCIVDGGQALYEGSTSELRTHVRLLTAVAEAPPPAVIADAARFRVVRDRVHKGTRRLVVWAAEPGAFALLADPAWAALELPLEELFIEVVRKIG
jgi:ABC-2 type transport system ATP-binding protein